MIITIGTDVRSPEKIRPIELSEVIDMMCMPKVSDEIEALINAVRAEPDIEKRKAIKIKLPYIVAGTFKAKRHTSDFIESSLMIFDFDHVADFHDLYFNKISNEPFVHFAFRSPSGDGIKCGIRLLRPLTDPREYTIAYKHCAKKLSEFLGAEADKTCDVARACFLSFDEDIVYNRNSDLWIPQTEEPKQQQKAYTPKYTEADKADKDFAKVEQLARTANISDYHDWIEAAISLRTAYGHRGLELFKTLSLGKGSKDSAKDIEKKWNTLPDNSALTIATFIHLARKHGGSYEN